MEAYFSQSNEAKMPDTRPELAYQVGTTPEMVEVPRCMSDPHCADVIAQQLPARAAASGASLYLLRCSGATSCSSGRFRLFRPAAALGVAGAPPPRSVPVPRPPFPQHGPLSCPP